MMITPLRQQFFVVAVLVAISALSTQLAEAAAPCSSQSSAATLDISVKSTATASTSASALTTQLASIFGVSKDAFSVTAGAAAGNCSTAGSATTCNHFNVQVLPGGVARNGNRVNFTAPALEAMLVTLFRNSSSPNDAVETLDAFGWDSVSAVTPSCATDNAKNIALGPASSVTTPPPPLIASGTNMTGCEWYTVSGVSDVANSADKNKKQQPALVSAFDAATTGPFQFVGQPSPASGATTTTAAKPSDRCCFKSGSFVDTTAAASTSDIAAALRVGAALQDNATVTSAVINALTLRAKASAIGPAATLTVTSNAPQQQQQCPTLHTGTKASPVAPMAMVVEFSCGDGSSNRTQAILQDADNVSQQLVSKFPAVFSYIPSSLLYQVSTSSDGGSETIQSDLVFGGAKKMYINSTFFNATSNATQRICGVLLFAQLNNLTAPFSALDSLLTCSSQWAAANAGDYVATKKKKATPPLFLISFICTGVLWIALVGYVYKFAPKERRYDFPNQNLQEAMLDESEKAARAFEEAATGGGGGGGDDEAAAGRTTDDVGEEEGGPASRYSQFSDGAQEMDSKIAQM